MCDWNNLFQKKSQVVKATFGNEIERGSIDAPKNPGVYAVRRMSCNKPKLIQRMFKCDRDGILHFGCTANLKDRSSSFIRGARTGKEDSASMRFYHLKREYTKRGYSSVQIAYSEHELRKAQKIERCWFKKYKSLFGELPPLDRKEE